jgi:hypothetical protein
MALGVTNHAYEQFVTYFDLPSHALIPVFEASVRVTSNVPFVMQDGFTYHHNASIDAYFVVSRKGRKPTIVTVLHPSRTRLADVKRSSPNPRPATFHSPLAEREWLKTELARLVAIDNPALKITIESLSNEIRTLKNTARAYRKNLDKYKDERRAESH